MGSDSSARLHEIAANVFMDRDTGHTWDELVQRDFLADTFAALTEALPDRLRDIRFYVFSPNTLDQQPASRTRTEERKVLIYLSDEANALTPHDLAPHYLAIFKPSMVADRIGRNIFTMSLGLMNGVPANFPRPIAARTVDVLFTGNLNRNRYPLYFALHPILRHVPALARSGLFHLAARSPAGRLLRRDFRSADGARQVLFTAGFGKGLGRAEYGAALADSRIVLAPRGFVSGETFRHYEALRAGAVVISDALPDTYLYRGSPFQCVADWREGLRLADALLDDPARLQQLQDAGLRWYAHVLGPQAAARRMIDRLTDDDL